MIKSIDGVSTVFRRFCQGDSGNMALMFALLFLPFTAVLGIAVDLNIANSARGGVQRSIDAAIMAAAREKVAGADSATIEASFSTYFDALLKTEPGQVVCQTPVFDAPSDSLTLTANVRCESKTMIASAVGRSTVEFDIESTATFGIGKLDIAMIFDVSGSMNDPSAPGTNQPSRLSALKTAAQDAVEILLTYNSSDTDDVRIALASYSHAVNAGNYFDEVTGLNASRTVSETVTGYKWDYICYWRYWWGQCGSGEWVQVPYNYTTSHSFSNSCTYERNSEEYDEATEPRSGHYLSAESASYNSYYGYWYNPSSCNAATPVPLTADETTLDNYILGLSATGGTAGHLGIAWGRYLLSPDWASVWPTDSEPLAWNQPDAKKVIIMMTDGDFNSTYHSNLGTSVEQAEDLCDDAKNNDGVLIYTIAFNAPTSGQEILAYCASEPEFAFDANNGQELLDAYTAIAASISDLRIAS